MVGVDDTEASVIVDVYSVDRLVGCEIDNLGDSVVVLAVFDDGDVTAAFNRVHIYYIFNNVR